MRLRWFRDNEGEPTVYSFTVNYSARDKKGARPRHGGWFLFWPKNEFYVQWVLFPGSRFSYEVQFDDTDESDIQWTVSIPFLLTLYFGIRNVKWLLRLLGLSWQQVRDKPMRDWRRELGVSWHHGALWITPWVNSNEWTKGKRGEFCINPADIIFGRKKYSESNKHSFDDVIEMPEGDYPAKIQLYIASWERPRWPITHSIMRAEIEVEGGIPVPGKGENSWDMEDDAVYGITMTAASIEEAKQKTRDSVLRDRIKYAHEGWIPDKGWTVK